MVPRHVQWSSEAKIELHGTHSVHSNDLACALVLETCARSFASNPIPNQTMIHTSHIIKQQDPNPDRDNRRQVAAESIIIRLLLVVSMSKLCCSPRGKQTPDTLQSKLKA